MWQLDNRTPFAADRTWVRDRDGSEIWLVAVKSTFEIGPDGALAVAAVQPAVTQVPVHHGKPGESSLRHDTDLPRCKTTTDIIVIGHAHAPGGEPVRELDVGLAVGPVVKILRVFGDRVWQGSRIGRAEPFVSMPLVWERAYGGRDPGGDPAAWDERNPVGQGFAMTADSLDGRPLPNIESTHHPITRWDDRPEPAGFGPLACHWLARRRYAGTYDEKWQQERLPLLPDDFDDRHYQCAPHDQWAPQFLRGGEPVVLRHLTPGGADMRFTLPRVFIGLETFFYAGASVRHPPPRLHTVILEPDQARVQLVWHSALPCHPRVLKLDRTSIVLKQDLRDGALAGRPADATA